MSRDAVNEVLRTSVAALRLIVEAVRDAGPKGLALGELYAALSAHGCTIDQFHLLVNGMQEQGLARVGSQRIVASAALLALQSAS